ncbi:MAG: tetratricopeptide repeat protein [Flagellimonas sp.]
MIFKLMAITMPFVLLAVMECTLRIFDYGDSLELFIPYDVDGQYLMFNPRASEKYFNNPQFATQGNTELFKQNKDERTVRFFVLGESTTIGYPYFHNGSFHRWLQYRMMQTFPEQNFEIINLSLTAVNSYTILGFAEELMDYEPDAILIYVGHNEYYGAMGVGSSQFIGDYPLLANVLPELRKLRVMQLGTQVFFQLKKFFSGGNAKPNTTRMESMVAERHIPFNSNLYKKGLQQYKTNLRKVLALFHDKNIPVFLGNLVSNEKDLVPFISTPEYKVPSQKFILQYRLGQQALKNGDSLQAMNHFKKANDFYPEHAQCNYFLGMLNYQQKEYPKARKYYIQAKELDQLRFRAPNESNNIISSLAGQYENTHLVDIRSDFVKSSKAGILGEELLIDHVHPNLMGFALMSKTYYEALMEAKLLPPNNAPDTMSFKGLLKEMPISVMDSIYGEYIIHSLKSNWPYNHTQEKQKIISSTLEQRLAAQILEGKLGWRQANDSLYAYYTESKQFEKAAKVAEALVLEYSEDPVFYDTAGSLNMNLGKYDLASFYFKKSFHLRPSVEKAKYLSIHFLRMDRPKSAMPLLDYVIAYSKKDRSIFLSISKMTENILKLKGRLSNNQRNNVNIENEIADIYLEMNNREAALKYVDIVLQKDPQNERAQAIGYKLNQKNNGKL